eukprot:711475-Rhodomonas_salina.1
MREVAEERRERARATLSGTRRCSARKYATGRRVAHAWANTATVPPDCAVLSTGHREPYA